MITTVKKSYALAGLGTAAAGLLYLNWSLWVTAVDTSPTHFSATDQAIPVATDEALAMPTPAGEFPETLDRPVFLATRRPIPPKAVDDAGPQTAAVAQLTPDNLELRGVMRLDGKRAKALIRWNTEPPGTWVHIGDSIKGWSVREIHDDVAVIETNGQRYELRLPYRSLAMDDRTQASR